ncbi:hypothetical protein BO83DRAFT_394569 [Aspergillus eucalypticola CBS 122712]|uniref:Uncharacterized protein n=1 Tax=Aspergillus eucalypticola (strain CBS 122712 / IBT 29274) TaxID=1448314 RepID=A0A317WF95_ASPEC|nr:uncharacterized protein BO83DRAFT_394569 [Aspergillus eucalypticola CBS 122712]PWY85124.1 hypothetical protein BO83DRAFT_394569 [Aspergillus eucalypticola CBS 122712]
MSTLTPNKIASRGPADELLDPERRRIIAQMSAYIEHVKLPSTGWALLWFTNLAILRKYLKTCQESEKSEVPMDVAGKCRSRGSLASQEGAEEQDIERTPKKRQRTSETASRIPTLAGNTRPAAVGPQETTKQPAGRSESAKKLWKAQVLGPNGTETCSNLMCMSNLAHKLWETARFALNPLSISEDKKVLKVSDSMSSRDIPSPFPDGCVSSIKVEGKPNTKLFDIHTEKALRSGDTLTFKTDDPVGHPLPSMELLNMQWALHRVLALSGAADATDEELDPPDPDWLQVEATDEDSEEEVESETEEDDPEEESWDEMVVESHQSNFPSCEIRPASTLPRSRHDDHKDQEEQTEPADAEPQYCSFGGVGSPGRDPLVRVWVHEYGSSPNMEDVYIQVSRQTHMVQGPTKGVTGSRWRNNHPRNANTLIRALVDVRD